LEEALAKRDLPEMYVRVVTAGVQSQSLPGMLTLLADYYASTNALGMRLKGLMVYPVIVLIASLILSVFLTLLYTGILKDMEDVFTFGGGSGPREMQALFWVAPVVFLGLTGLFILPLTIARIRHWLRWKVPGFRDASLAQSASAMSLMLESGTQLDSALHLLEEAEAGSIAAKDLGRWRQLLRSGAARFQEMAAESSAFPPLFIWLVAQGGEDLASGFRRAGEIYGARAHTRTDMLLYAALPLAIVFLGFLMLTQVYSIITIVSRFISLL
jgi:type II secretory pathway component PulF